MLTPGEIGAVEAALGELERQVARLDARYESERPWYWWTPVALVARWDRHGTDRAARADEIADGRRNVLRLYRRRRDELVEAPGAMHEEALEFVRAVRKLAGDGIEGLVAAELNAAAAARSPTQIARDAVSTLAGWLGFKPGKGGARPVAVWILVGLLVVVLLPVVASALAGAVARALAARR